MNVFPTLRLTPGLAPGLAPATPFAGPLAGFGECRPPIDAEGDEPLAQLMGEVVRETAADGIVVAWHDGDADPLILFEEGLCEPRPAVRGAIAEAALRAASRRERLPSPQWCVLDHDADVRGMTAGFATDTGVVTVTTLFRRTGAAARLQAREATARLMPVVQPFLRLWSARRRTLSRVRALTAAVNKSDVGILLVNQDGRLVFANAAADALIARGDGLRRSAGMLSGTRLADTLRLHAAIEHVVRGDSPRAAATAPVVALTRQSGRPLLAAVVSSDAAPSRGEEGAAIIYVFDPSQDLRPLIEPACKLYGLSPVETRLVCLLTDGVCLVAAAERMHVREQTARSYLKQIFLKTDTNRQAELVWLMLKSSVRTSPGCRATLV